MYFKISLMSGHVLFHTMQEAKHLLLKTYLWVQNQDGILLDYLLLPNSLEFLIQLPNVLQKHWFLHQQIHIQTIHTEDDLLSAYKSLTFNIPSKARSYPLCGTYEAYHRSECYSVLGKTGEKYQFFPLQTILKLKNQTLIQSRDAFYLEQSDCGCPRQLP